MFVRLEHAIESVVVTCFSAPTARLVLTERVFAPIESSHLDCSTENVSSVLCSQMIKTYNVHFFSLWFVAPSTFDKTIWAVYVTRFGHLCAPV
jgi:hypothetical protein